MALIDMCRLAAVAALAAASSASAFQSSSPSNLMTRDMSSTPLHPSSSTSSSSPPHQRQSVATIALMAYLPPLFDPYFNPYEYFPYPLRGSGPPPPPPPPMMPMRTFSFYDDPRYPYSAVGPLYDTEVIIDADDLLDEMREEEEDEWMTDKQRAQNRRKKGGNKGEVINTFDSDEPPMKSAAAYPSDMYEDENVFQGRKPGQAVNKDSSSFSGKESFQGSSRAPVVDDLVDDEDDMMRDPREQHVVLDDYDEYMNDFFDRPPMPRGPPNQQRRRPGPSVYTQEEEDLIASMGGRGRPTTQEFAGLGTMKNSSGSAAPGQYDSKMPMDPQQQNYNPEQQDNFIPPPPPPGFDPRAVGGGGYREEGYLGDSTLKEISLDYAVPIPYLADVLATWGTPVPIDPLARLGDMVTGEQAFAILEAIHTLDIAALHERYSEDNLMNICDYYDIDIKEAFDFCVERGWALPFGVRTFLRVEQEEEMLDALGGEVF